MRTLSELNKNTRSRIVQYVKQWPTLSSKEIAEDLYIRKSTVAAIRANITRQLANRFNEALS